MSRRDAHRRERRAAIEEGALAIVRDEGLDALTMPALARRVGGAVGALYRYFESKEALLLVLQLRALDAFDELLVATLEAHAQAPPLEQVREALRSWGRFTQAEPELHELLQLSIAHPRAVLDDARAATVAHRFAPLVARCAERIAQATEDGTLTPGDPETRVWILWGAVSGLGQLRKQDARRPEHLAADRLVDAAIDTLLCGWRVGGEALDP